MTEKSKHEGREDVWFTAEGEADGKPLIFRGRQHVPAGIIEAGYPYLVSIFWPYEPENDSGMPDRKTEDAQVEFEDVMDGLDSPGMGFLMLVVTGNGQKEWHWYVSDVDAWMARMNESVAGHPAFPIEIESSHEPDWATYHDFISGVDGI